MRKKIMLLHLIVASLITPLVLLVSISGGLYLIGFKGSTTSSDVPLATGTQLDFESKDLEAKVRELIKGAGIHHEFEYLRVRENVIQTRPTSRVYLEFKQENLLSLTVKKPNFQKKLIELHKGHGPRLFKLYQKACAIGLILVLLSGVFMGFINQDLRPKVIASLVLGFTLFIVIGFV